MFYISGQAVASLGEHFRTQSAGIQGELDTLDGKVQQVLGQWEGGAQTAYQTAQLDWTQKMTGLQTSLFSIGTKLEEIVLSYNQADRQGANLFQ
ncbi:MAG: WXG100 family type VII secretion target [Micrococcales bacterium]|nr:WXG100 family type VII secretion target [Micrococcales bacterium]MCL2666974.1 WXG100 family type VII secretion target [Micrococcales bacterium]